MFSHSPQECCDEVNFLHSVYPTKPLWPFEYNWNPESSIFFAQSRAMAKLPGVLGIGGPFK
jgi:hypothetical protein